MADEIKLSIPQKGMNTDSYIMGQNTTTYPFALNAVIEDFWYGNQGFIANEPSNICSVTFPPNYKVVGFVKIHELKRTIYLLNNKETGLAQFGEVIDIEPHKETDIIESSFCDDCGFKGDEKIPLEKRTEQCFNSYNLIVPASCLNLSNSNFVDIEYRITSNSVNIYFTDGKNERRYLYFDYDVSDITSALVVQDRFKEQIGTEGECLTPVYSNTLDCNKLKIHPDFTIPCVEYKGFVNGGNLKEGTYQVLIAYADVYGNPISEYFPSTQNMPLFENVVAFDTNTTTSKALSFNINDLQIDNIFEYYNIVIAQTIDQFTEFINIGTFPTSQSSYVYTGYEKTLKRLSSTEVLYKRPFYETATGVTKANNYLFFSNVKEYKTLNLQPIVNKIELEWQTVAIKEGAYNNPLNTAYYKTYNRDEVYAIGIDIEFNNGRMSQYMHIPAREATEYDLENITNNDVIDLQTCTTVSTKPRWKVYNTASVTGTPHNILDNCKTTENNIWEYGKFAYWESTRKYPNIPEVWGSLCNKPIRHHKFPDSNITHIHDGLNGSKIFTDNNYIYPIGIKINHDKIVALFDAAVKDGLITQEERDSISGYRIVRGNRVGQKSVIAKGLLYNMFSYNKYCDTDTNCKYYYPNYPYNDLSEDDFIKDATLANQDRFTFHSPDTHFVNASLGNILKLESQEYGKSEGYFTYSDCQAKFKFLSIMAQSVAFGLGIAAALSATGKKQCKVIEFTANNTIDFGYSSEGKSSSTEDQSSALNTAGTALGTTIGATVGGPIGAAIGGAIGGIASGMLGGLFGGGKSETKITGGANERYSNLTGVNAQDPITGDNQSVTGANNGDVGTVLTPNNVTIGGFNDALVSKKYKIDDGKVSSTTEAITTPSKVTYTTCKGEKWQEFNGSILSTILESIADLGSAIVGTALNFLTVDKDLLPGQMIQRTIIAIEEMDKVMATMKALVPFKNFGMQYNSVGKYNNYNNITINNVNRLISKSAYLTPDIQEVDENGSPVKINNWNREESVYLKLASPLVKPTYDDNSKVSMRNAFGKTDSTANLNKTVQRNICSYYASIKNEILDQYGDICNVEYLETTGCSFKLNRTYTNAFVYGGDTFINRFALKRKVPFFLHTACNLPNNTDILYEDLYNIGTPRYFFNTEQPLYDILTGFFDITTAPIKIIESTYDNDTLSLVNRNKHAYDTFTRHTFYQEGLIDLFNYGIPYFLVESDINVDFRTAQNNTDKDFYPHNKDLKRWLEEGTNPISNPNNFYYNRTFSRQNKETVNSNSCIKQYRDIELQSKIYNALIYSEQANLENKSDNWLIFKANNIELFNPEFGKLISADGIENDKVLVRLEKGSKIFNAYNVLQATEQNIQVGTGGMFKTAPQDIAVTDLGFSGTQNRDILHTEFGHIWADAERGSVISLGLSGSGIKDLSKEGMNSWFKENLPFNISKQFPNYKNIDNNLNGIGLHYAFDKRFNRILITKLDYKVLDKSIQYDEVKDEFYIPLNEISKNCADGYTYNEQTQTCEKIEYVEPTYTTSPIYSVQYPSYGRNGAWFYDKNYNVVFKNTNDFWKASVNRLSKWVSQGEPPYDTPIGFDFCVTASKQKDVYLGITGDNIFDVYLDDILIFSNRNNITNVDFQELHVIPITLTGGSHKLSMKVTNVSDPTIPVGNNPGSIAAEIYDNTFDAVINATSKSQLNIIFSTENQTTFPMLNYSCEIGYDLIQETNQCGIYKCKKIYTLPPIPSRKVVSLYNPKYFCNKSWTISYNFYTNSWTSFHSYTPLFYNDKINTFESSIVKLSAENGNLVETQKLYSHNATNKSYQVFYGKLNPFIIDTYADIDFSNKLVTSVEFYLDVLRYHNNYDTAYLRNKTFNKVSVGNETQTSGILNLHISNPEDLTEVIKYPYFDAEGKHILTTNTENIWRFNDFFDIVKRQNNNVPIYNYDCNNVNYKINTNAIKNGNVDEGNRINGRACKVRYIQDIYSNYKYIFGMGIVKQQTTIR